MKAVLYIVAVDGASAIEGEIAVPTLKEALALRAGEGPGCGQIQRIETPDLPIRELLSRVFNRRQYGGHITTVREAFPHPGERRDRDRRGAANA